MKYSPLKFTKGKLPQSIISFNETEFEKLSWEEQINTLRKCIDFLQERLKEVTN